MKNKLEQKQTKGEMGEIVIYRPRGGQAGFEVRLADETIWLNSNQLADLFERDKSVISRHRGNIFRSGELLRRSTVAKYATVQMEGGREVTRQVEYFNLDAIIFVGYGELEGRYSIPHLGNERRRLQWRKVKRRVSFPKLGALVHAILDMRDEMREKRRPVDCVSSKWIGDPE